MMGKRKKTRKEGRDKRRKKVEKEEKKGGKKEIMKITITSLEIVSNSLCTECNTTKPP